MPVNKMVREGRDPGLPTGRSATWRYGAAAGCLALAWLARLALAPYIGEQHPYATFFVAVAATSWFAGGAPALWTAVLGYVAAEYTFAGIRHALVPHSVSDVIGQASYFVVSLSIILFAHLMRKARSQALSRQAELEREIGERSRAEEELRRNRADLTRAQAVAHIGSWRLDVRSNELHWSAESHRMFGIPENTPLSYETFLGAVHPEDRDFVDRAWQAALRSEPYDIEHRIRVGGAVRWVREQAELEFDRQGGLLGGFGTVQDITERKLIEEELARRTRMKDEFLALLGHELRNPLAALVTSVDVLGGNPSVKHRASLVQMMRRQLEVLRRIVDDLLDLTRVTQGRIKLRPEPIELGQLLQDAASAASPHVADRGQELALRLPSDQILFMADGIRLGQVLANLLDNASRYTERGGRIELSGALEEREVVLRCKDNGSGIPPEMQQSIFEPFIRAQKTGESVEAGVGVGLSLVRRLVELHGGTVTVESKGPGMGSEFAVRLPFIEPPVSTPAPGRAGTHLPGHRGLSLVLVEDSPDIARSMVMALEQAGYRVTLFSDGPSALGGVESLSPAAVVLDIELPGMDGYELAARLRQKRNLRQAVFIALSGFERREEAASPSGDFDHYLMKPVDIEKLVALLAPRGRAAFSGS